MISQNKQGDADRRVRVETDWNYYYYRRVR